MKLASFNVELQKMRSKCFKRTDDKFENDSEMELDKAVGNTACSFNLG